MHLGGLVGIPVDAGVLHADGGAPLVLLRLAAHTVRVRVGEVATSLASTATAERVVQTLAVCGGAETLGARKGGGESDGGSDSEEGLHDCVNVEYR